MDDERSLRRRARAKIDRAEIPNRSPIRLWGGPPGSVTCAICDRPLPHSELAVTVLFEPLTLDVRGEVYHLHLRCFAAWEFERSA
jgi:hypothetical protein